MEYKLENSLEKRIIFCAHVLKGGRFYKVYVQISELHNLGSTFDLLLESKFESTSDEGFAHSSSIYSTGCSFLGGLRATFYVRTTRFRSDCEKPLLLSLGLVRGRLAMYLCLRCLVGSSRWSLLPKAKKLGSSWQL